MSTAIEVLKLLDEPTIVAMLQPPLAVDFRALAKIIKGPILPDAMNPCGKRWYRSKEEARGPYKTTRIYYCHGCDGFHIRGRKKR